MIELVFYCPFTVGDDVINVRRVVASAVLAGAQISMTTHRGSVDKELVKKTGATSIIWT